MTLKTNKILDLHGIKHAEVPRILDEFLWDNMKVNSNEVEVITGSSDTMKKIVIQTLNEYGFNYHDEWNNPGKIIVRLV